MTVKLKVRDAKSGKYTMREKGKKKLDEVMERGARQGLEKMLGLKPGEKVCIVTDDITAQETDNAFVRVAEEITGKKNVTVYTLENYGRRPLKDVPKGLEKDVEKANVTLFVAQSIGKELETVRKPLIKTAALYGARHGHCPGFTREIMEQGMNADYDTVYALSHALFDVLFNVKRITVTSKAGTNLVVDTLKHFPWVYSKPIEKGKMANLPDGEIFCAPYNVNGTAVIDGCVGDFLSERYGNISKTPLSINIHAGMIAATTMDHGNPTIYCPANSELENDFRLYVMNLHGEREYLTRKVGEFALGTNLGVKKIIGNLLQDEKCARAVHIAFGDPLDFDGTQAHYECKGHIDCLIMNPTVKADGKVIMDHGVYVEDVMRRALEYAPTGSRLSKDGKRLITLKL